MEKPNSSKMSAIVTLYDMQTDFFKRALEGISDEDSHKRLNTKANHIAWLTGSLVDQRFYNAKELEINEQMQAHELFENNKGIQDDVKYPSLNVFREDWEKITPLLRNAFLTITDEQLERQIEMGPDMKMSIYDLITFSMYREANIIGQIALWRRLLDYPAMKYM